MIRSNRKTWCTRGPDVRVFIEVSSNERGPKDSNTNPFQSLIRARRILRVNSMWETLGDFISRSSKTSVLVPLGDSTVSGFESLVIEDVSFLRL